MSLERKPVQIVEMDLDVCSRTYGSAPCTAALSAATPRKCFNTFATCQDTANFNKTTRTVRFGRNQSGLPKGTLVYPALQGVSTNPASINLGNDDRTGPLGKRARVTVDLLDFADSDLAEDPYQAERISGAAQFSGTGYVPRESGTFFGRQHARNPYYVGRALRVLDGYAGEALAAMRTRHYVITDRAGPDMAGRVRITAKDVLDLADNEKALCPTPNTGKLAVEIAGDDAAPVFGIEPAGTGDAEYAASGRLCIGSEIMTFTRAGDTFTVVRRGLDGTSAESHARGDLVQQCYRVENTAIHEVAQELLEDFAGIDSAFVPIADWEAEAIWLHGFELTATVAKPTGVAKLIGELAEHGAFWWWDDVAQEIRMRVNRPPAWNETLPALTDAAHLVEGSLGVSDLEDQRLTQLIFWHGQIDATGDANDGENYARAFVAVNDGGSANRHDQDRMREVFSRWLGPGNDSVAQAVARRLANRFEVTPRQVTFTLDAKDRAVLTPGDLFTLTTRALQDATGASVATQMQVISVEEHQPGHALRVTAITSSLLGRYGLITGNSRPDYSGSTAEQIAKGTYIVNSGTLLFSDGTGPYVTF